MIIHVLRAPDRLALYDAVTGVALPCPLFWPTEDPEEFLTWIRENGGNFDLTRESWIQAVVEWRALVALPPVPDLSEEV